ncbi:hypothetical protein BE04_23210 [Sorangium cellulosum]|uniref:Uncharacterized protein n=2 Tax=Sorangium cellulosum TaxID=56 RepID=A0A150P6V7_SORCE|nr:hypothetical protein SCE1572_34690 [Sorangium cellulosum So0157-2]KYF51422.1 hypothetical protein BE04_23210 [Sorangium cellulosum]
MHDEPKSYYESRPGTALQERRQKLFESGIAHRSIPAAEGEDPEYIVRQAPSAQIRDDPPDPLVGGADTVDS